MHFFLYFLNSVSAKQTQSDNHGEIIIHQAQNPIQTEQCTPAQASHFLFFDSSLDSVASKLK